jgi:hypothetical protein
VDTVDERLRKLQESGVSYRIACIRGKGYQVDLGNDIGRFTDWQTFKSYEGAINWLLEESGLNDK